jgi:hypothetical protein
VNVVSIDLGCRPASATIKPRLLPVRLFFDFLMVD